MENSSEEWRESLRLRYRPRDIRVLFVGESPPSNGTFFYAEDSNLWRYTREAFARIYGDRARNGFCSFFCSFGCYLEDLCHEPVNQLRDGVRRRRCEAGVMRLASGIKRASPLAVIGVKSSISPQVIAAVHLSELPEVKTFSLPFPGCGHQNEYVGLLAEIISELRHDRSIS